MNLSKISTRKNRWGQDVPFKLVVVNSHSAGYKEGKEER